MNVQLQSHSGIIEIWRIDEPVVTAPTTVIPQIQLNAGDMVGITAGGCVQTGGVGKTWKRYVNPSGPNSDHLYHGTVLLPGMGGFVRLAAIGSNYVVPPGSFGPLQIGYEDDEYSDNGYWEHDDGTEDQCKGVGNAWLTITIARSAVAARIAGVEFTQTIQYFNFNGQGSGFAPDNSIPMVSGKPTVIRVYPDVMTGGPTQIDGTLTLTGATGGSAGIPSLTGAIQSRSASDIQRAEWTDTLNFLIPASDSIGSIEFEVAIFDASDTSKRTVTSGLFQVAFIDVPPVSFHSVLIHYIGPDFFDKPVDTQTSGFDVLLALDFVLRTYPISSINFDGCEVLQWTSKLAVTANFSALFTQLANLRAMAGSDDIYIGVIPNEANCGAICGLGGGGAALFFVGSIDDGTDGSHEIGHAIGRAHAPECLPSGQIGDTNYPQYNGFPRTSIGECGVDTRLLRLFDPATHHDYMSYCGTPLRWVSPYGYLFALKQVQSGVFSGPTGAEENLNGRVRGEASVHFMSFSLRRPGASQAPVQMVASFQLTRAIPHISEGIPTTVQVELYDQSGLWLLSVPCFTDNTTDANDCSPLRPYFAYFPDYPECESIRVVREGTELGAFHRSSQTPVIEKFRMENVSEGEKRALRLTWRASADREAVPPLQYGLRFSRDGKRWRSLAAALTDNFFSVDLDFLPGGKDCRIQLVASAGFRTATRELQLAERQQKPRTLYLVSPADNAEFEAGAPVPLAGTAFSPDYGTCSPEELIWTALTAGHLGVGQQLTVTHLPIGTHNITLHAPDGHGGEQTKSVRVRITRGRQTVASKPRRPLRGKPPCGCRK